MASILSISPDPVFIHILFAMALSVLSFIVTRFMLHHFPIIDFPNARSSHRVPTPKSGGIAIVATFLAGVIFILALSENHLVHQRYYYGFVFSAVLVAAISLYDDIKQKPFIVKLITQLIAVFLVLAFGVVIDQIALPFVGALSLGAWAYPVSFLWIIGLTNSFNFIDGIDGLAAGVALIVSIFFCAITLSQGSTFVYITSYTLIAGTLGVLVFNFPPARIFMGDVGSAFLGFVFAVLAIIAARYDESHTSFMVMPLLLFNVIYDTFFTFVRRLFRGENVFTAHRTHLYQLFNRLGFRQRTVTLFHYTVCVAQGFAAIWMVNIPGGARTIVYVPFLVFQIAYSVVIVRAGRRAGLL